MTPRPVAVKLPPKLVSSYKAIIPSIVMIKLPLNLVSSYKAIIRAIVIIKLPPNLGVKLQSDTIPVIVYSYVMPVCSIVKIITPRCRGRPDALLHEVIV